MTLVLLDDQHTPLTIDRQPDGVARREDVLRDLLFAHPEILPITDIAPHCGRVVPVARELNIPDVGRIDALLVDERGQLIVVECKLWRNPQARREVVGQILDYARALARFGYDDLQREISRATKRKGNVLFDLVRAAGSKIDEARFVDQVSRDLRAGRFILLIVGDGITEGTQRIGEYLRDQPGLSFEFGLIEMADYRFRDPVDGQERRIVQPRVLAKTTLIERSVIRNEAPGIVIEPIAANDPADGSGRSAVAQTAQREAWSIFASRFIADMRFDDPGQPSPRIGNLNWLYVVLPDDNRLTLWRSSSSQQIGGFVQFKGSKGRTSFDALLADREAIDREFEAAGLPAPTWDEQSDIASVGLERPTPMPWDAAQEQEQADYWSQVANQFVNSLRPRLLTQAARSA